MARAPEKLINIVRTAVEPMGYELLGIEYIGQGGSGNILRVYIDHEGGIDVDDCAVVSHQVSGVLDVEDPIPGNYALEVSSPGMDRPLFEKAHFEQFVGSQVKVTLDASIEGRRRFKGVLKAVEGDDILLIVDNQEYLLPLAQIEKARLVPEF